MKYLRILGLTHGINIRDDKTITEISCKGIKRPYDIHSSTSIYEAKQMFTTLKVHYSSNWHSGCKDLIKQLLYLDPEKRISSLEALQKHSFIAELDFDRILHREIKPPFVPSVRFIPNKSLLHVLVKEKPFI